jgi:general secretion pathway protein H
MEKGFTLLELLVVLTIVALAATVAAPLLSGGKDKEDFAASVRTVATALREARSLALTTNRSQALLVDVDRGAVRIGNAGRLASLPKSVRLSLLTVAQERVDRGTGAIRFFSDGSSTGGRLTLLQGNRRSDVMVDWLSGRISIDDPTRAP